MTSVELKKHVCVIGFGTSALFVLIELLIADQQIIHVFDSRGIAECFETLPNTITLNEDEREGCECTLVEFAKSYINQQKSVHFHHTIKSVHKCRCTNKWMVSVESEVNGLCVIPFDSIAICTGMHSFPFTTLVNPQVTVSSHRLSQPLPDSTLAFNDYGTECDSPAIPISATTERNAFPFLNQQHRAISTAGMNPRTNYKQIFCIDHPDVAFIGFARSDCASIDVDLRILKAQARLFAQVTSGEISLPSKTTMRRVARADQHLWETMFGYDAILVRGIVDEQLYCESIERLIMGELPLLSEIVWCSRPWLWARFMSQSLSLLQYRLPGTSYRNPRHVEEELARKPLLGSGLLECGASLCYVVGVKLLTKLGFSRFQIKGFQWD